MSATDDYFKSEEQLQAEEEVRLRRAEYERTLADVLHTPAGYRLILYVLRRLGAGRRPTEDPREVAVNVVAYELLQDIAVVAPNQWVALQSDLHGIIR